MNNLFLTDAVVVCEVCKSVLTVVSVFVEQCVGEVVKSLEKSFIEIIQTSVNKNLKMLSKNLSVSAVVSLAAECRTLRKFFCSRGVI